METEEAANAAWWHILFKNYFPIFTLGMFFKTVPQFYKQCKLKHIHQTLQWILQKKSKLQTLHFYYRNSELWYQSAQKQWAVVSVCLKNWCNYQLTNQPTNQTNKHSVPPNSAQFPNVSQFNLWPLTQKTYQHTKTYLLHIVAWQSLE